MNQPTTAQENLPSPHMMANAIRALSMDAVQAANSGHPGMPMGMADVATVLFRDILKYDASATDWADRDRFVLSAGHGSMLQYALMYLTGYEDISLDDIKNFRQLGAPTAGHPEFGHARGIETTTGPLGQGLATAVGMALAESCMAARFGEELVDHYTYTIAGDGCLMEGISQEAISLAGHLKLNKLVVLFDDNGISIDGPTSLSTSENHVGRFEACGWDVQEVDGHDQDAVFAAIERAKNTDTPSMIACKTQIGKGAPTKAGTAGSHGAPLGDEEIAGTRSVLGWDYPPFEIPADILEAWRDAGARGRITHAEWKESYERSSKREAFDEVLSGNITDAVKKAIAELKQQLLKSTPKEASRKSSQNTLDALHQAVPNLLGGSADLTGSNNTKAVGMGIVSPEDKSGAYIHYGIREHAMGAVMNGIALHGGFVPYGGTFMVFTDYCRPAIRLSALMEQRVIYVMTHDSIGLGEDGPTHQPIEHLASLRAMPNVHTFRPCDALETAECWELALTNEKTPSILALSRQGLPFLSQGASEENRCAKGGYVISPSLRANAKQSPEDNAGDRHDAPASRDDDAVILATGSEVYLAIEAQAALKEQGIAVRVVSMPCTELFDAQSKEYQDSVLGDDATPKVAVEAAMNYGWERYIGRNGVFIGMNGFGASAPAPELYKHFGITTGAIVEAVKSKV